MRDCATLDSNVLVYKELETDDPKGRRAGALIEACAPTGVLAVQACLEFFAVVRRKRPDRLTAAIESLEVWTDTFRIAPTTPQVARAALQLSRDHSFQVWDAVIWSAARMAGATVFISEDLRDGLILDGMTVVNPFILTDDAFAALIAD